MKRKEIFVTAFVLIAALAVLAGCGGKATTTPTIPSTTPSSTTPSSTTPSSTTGASISIKNFSFNPATLTVAAHTTVTWKNDDSTTHTVSGSGMSSGNIAPGGTFQFTFDTPGTYNYQCTIHPTMTGQVVVTSGGSSGGTTQTTGGTTPTTPTTPSY